MILKTISLNILIDKNDYHKTSGINWRINKNGYVVGSLHHKTVYLHRIIMEAKSNQEVDHINRNKLDNRKSNLRLCERWQNTANRKHKIKSRSGYIGARRLDSGRYEARITCQNTFISISCTCETARDAAHLYDQFAIQLLGSYANTNFKYGKGE